MKLRMLCLWIASLSGCISNIDVLYARTNWSAPLQHIKSPDAVEVLSLRPSRGYAELGTLKVVYLGFYDEAAIRAALVREAAKQGCDAVVLRHQNLCSGVCLVYTAPPA